jgi:uncharacterized protein (TIGR02246 family)
MTSRPVLDPGGPRTDAARAVAVLVRDLQTGWDQRDATITDRRLARDVLWGSPFGATLRGYERLHDIHEELKRKQVGGTASRFEAVEWSSPAPGIVLAHVRRTALGDDGFSEMALYVLVERDGEWWVAAGQNTLIKE